MSKLYHSSQFNYPKIVLDETYTHSFTAGQQVVTETVPHGQSGVPDARVWYEPNAGEIWEPTNDGYPNANFYNVDYSLDSTNLYIEIDRNTTLGTLNLTVYYRVYKKDD